MKEARKKRNGSDSTQSRADAQDSWSLLVAFAMLCALLYSVNHGTPALMSRQEAAAAAAASRTPTSLPSQSPQAWFAPGPSASRLTP